MLINAGTIAAYQKGAAMKSTFAVVTGPEKIEYWEEELPPLGPHDLLVRTDAVGLCHTELPVFKFDRYPATTAYGYRRSVQVPYGCKLGHEPVGTVLEVGSAVTRFAPGDRISGWYNPAYATHRVIPDTAVVVKIPEMEKDYRSCVAEPMGCVTNILHKVMQDKVESVGVVGCGYMNLMTIPVLRKAGIPQVVAFDLLDSKLELAKKYGATDVINSTKEDCVDAVYQLTGGKFFDAVVEMSGSLFGLLTAAQTIKFSRVNDAYNGRGRIVITSVYNRQEVFPVDLASELVLRAPILDAAHPVSGEDMTLNMEEAVADFVDGTIPMDQLISHTVPFSRLAEGLKWLEHPPEGYTKGLVLFD